MESEETSPWRKEISIRSRAGRIILGEIWIWGEDTYHVQDMLGGQFTNDDPEGCIAWLMARYLGDHVMEESMIVPVD